MEVAAPLLPPSLPTHPQEYFFPKEAGAAAKRERAEAFAQSVAVPPSSRVSSLHRRAVTALPTEFDYSGTGGGGSPGGAVSRSLLLGGAAAPAVPAVLACLARERCPEH